jgi:hypothetical protein
VSLNVETQYYSRCAEEIPSVSTFFLRSMLSCFRRTFFGISTIAVGSTPSSLRGSKILFSCFCLYLFQVLKWSRKNHFYNGIELSILLLRSFCVPDSKLIFSRTNARNPNNSFGAHEEWPLLFKILNEWIAKTRRKISLTNTLQTNWLLYWQGISCLISRLCP